MWVAPWLLTHQSQRNAVAPLRLVAALGHKGPAHFRLRRLRPGDFIQVTGFEIFDDLQTFLMAQRASDHAGHVIPASFQLRPALVSLSLQEMAFVRCEFMQRGRVNLAVWFGQPNSLPKFVSLIGIAHETGVESGVRGLLGQTRCFRTGVPREPNQNGIEAYIAQQKAVVSVFLGTQELVEVWDGAVMEKRRSRPSPA